MLKVQEIRELIKLIDQSSIDEFSYEANGTKVSMKKQNQHTVYQTKEVPTVPAAEESVPAASQQAVNNQAAAPAPEETTKASNVDYDHEITSPMVGTFYSSPNPDSEVFVKKGDKVTGDTVVCIVEAMKLFNEIEADVKGEIVEVLVENGELVEYGQPLFRVKTQ